MKEEFKKNNTDQRDPSTGKDPVENSTPQNDHQGASLSANDLKEGDSQKLREELAQYKEKYVRLYAEFENARKRMEREKQEFVKYANEGLIVEFLSIVDDLERSLEAAKAKHEDYTAFLKGIEMVMAHIYALLKKYGAKPIEAKGKKFDPHYHEILSQEETDQFEDEYVMEEFQKGYCLGEKVVRPTKVKLAKRK